MRNIKLHSKNDYYNKYRFDIIIYVVISICIMYYCYRSIEFPSSLHSVYAKINQSFQLNKIECFGNHSIDSDTIKKIAQIHEGMPIIDANPSHIKQRLEGNGRILSVEVKRKWPEKITIYVSESKPIAIWYDNENQPYLIDINGSVIQRAEDDWLDYIVIQGKEANIEYKKIHSILYHFDLFHDILSMSYKGNRRWDVTLKGGTIIMLPEINVEEVANIAQEILQRKRNIKTLDLRIMSKRIYIKYYGETKK